MKITCEIFQSYFKALQNPTYPNEQPPTFPVSYLVIVMNHEIDRIQELVILHIDLLVLDHPEFHGNHRKIFNMNLQENI